MKKLIRFVAGPAWLILVLVEGSVVLLRKGERLFGAFLLFVAGALVVDWHRQDKKEKRRR